MTGNDVESATIEQALVFYQQHLVLERQKHESHLPRNGKSVATPEDVSRDQTFERQLQTIAAILESRKRCPNPSLGDIALPKPTNSPLLQLPKWNKSDSDPYINPITGQWIVPDTPFTPGPSNSGSVSKEQGLVETVKSIAIIGDPRSRNDTLPDALHSISKPADRKVNAPETRNQSKPFKSSSITRKPVNSSQPTRENFVLPPAELHFPSTPDGHSLAASKAPTNPYLLAKNTTTGAAFGWDSEGESEELLGEQGVSSLRAGSTDPKLAIANPGSLELPKPLRIDKQGPRPAGLQNGQETPWTFVTKPMTTVTEKTRPPVPTNSQQIRELSWNSGTPSHKPGTPISTKSQQSQETSWNLVTPTPAAKVTSPGHPAASQGNRKPSWSSVSTAELDGRPTFATQQSAPPSRPSIQPDHLMSTDSGLRQQPAFNPAELGKFPSEQGVGSTFDLPGQSGELGNGPGIARTRFSDSPNPFSSLGFANDPSIPAKPAQFSSMMPNDPRQPFLNSSQIIRPNQIQHFNYSAEQTQTNNETPGIEVDNALRLAAGIARQFASFVGQAEPNRGLSPDNFSAPFVSGNLPFHERHLDSTRPDGDVSQGHYVPFQMGNLNGMSVQGVGPFDTGRDLPSRTSPDYHAFRPLGGQNGIIPNQLRPFGFESESRHSADHLFGQLMTNDRSRGNEEFAEAQFRSRDTDDARMAQIIADRADRAELEALQRMQDEWNREDDMRLAKQQEVARRIQDEWNTPYAQEFQPQTWLEPRQREWSGQSRDPFDEPPVSRRDPTPWNPSRQDSADSIEFAPPPDNDDPHPAVAKNPQKSSPPQAQRLTPAQRNFDAAKAAEEEIHKYEAAHREREEKAKQAQLEKDKADKAAKTNQANCTACGDPDDKAKMAVLACTHAYDGDCIAQAFQHALAGGKLFHCCNKTPVPIDLAASFLSAQFVTTYKAKMLELATPNPIYCAAPGCSTFIPTSGIKGDMSTCPACSFVTCRLCKNPEHRGLCPPDKNGKKLLDLASNKNWRQCRRCNVVVERDEGCLHITCTCGYEFCYSCGGLWSQCWGKCPRSY
jgi:hypothetical protein